MGKSSDLAISTCSIPDGDEDAVYFVVKRLINGTLKYYVERQMTRRFTDIRDAVFMQSALTYDGRNVGAVTMTISGGVTWDGEETMTLTRSVAGFAAGDVGNEIHFYDADDVLILRFFIEAVVTGTADRTVPVSLRTTATTAWARAVDQVTGLGHLEGRNVSILGDGFVDASPYNDAYDLITVTAGVVNLDNCRAVIHVGLPYFTDIETLAPDTTQSETIADKNKLPGRITLFLKDTRGVFIGAAPPEGDEDDTDYDPLQKLDELKINDDQDDDGNTPPELYTGQKRVNIRAKWSQNGRIFIRQVDPLPLTLLAVSCEGLYPFKGQQ